MHIVCLCVYAGNRTATEELQEAPAEFKEAVLKKIGDLRDSKETCGGAVRNPLWGPLEEVQQRGALGPSRGLGSTEVKCRSGCGWMNGQIDSRQLKGVCSSGDYYLRVGEKLPALPVDSQPCVPEGPNDPWLAAPAGVPAPVAVKFWGVEHFSFLTFCWPSRARSFRAGSLWGVLFSWSTFLMFPFFPRQASHPLSVRGQSSVGPC